jgi:hypothetical protein
MIRVALAALVLVLGPAMAASEPLESKVRRYYDAAPMALKNLIERPKVELKVVESLGQLRTFSTDYHNGYAGSIVGRNIAGVAMTHPGKIPTLAFVRSAMTRSSDEFTQRAVLHEMMHLYDLFDGRSRQQNFLTDFEDDMEEIDRGLRRAGATEGNRNNYGHFTSAPIEAFAEAGARLIHHPVHKHWWINWLTLFPRVTRHVCVSLAIDKIIDSTCRL